MYYVPQSKLASAEVLADPGRDEVRCGTEKMGPRPGCPALGCPEKLSFGFCYGIQLYFYPRDFLERGRSILQRTHTHTHTHYTSTGERTLLAANSSMRRI